MLNRIITILLFFLVSITWGTTFIAMKIVVDTIPPFFATSMRFLLISPLLLIIAYFTNTPLFFPPGKKKFQLFICVFYFSIPFSLMLYGGTYINSIISSIIFAYTPIVILIVSAFFFKKKICFLQMFGLIITILFLCMFLFNEINLHSYHFFKGIFSSILAMISHSVIYLYSKEQYNKVSILTFNALPTLCSGLLLLFVSVFIENPIINTFSNKSILAIIYLSYFSGCFGILSYFYLQKRVSVIKASIVFLIFPLITLFLNNVLYNIKIEKIQFIFISCLMSSILLTLMFTNDKK